MSTASTSKSYAHNHENRYTRRSTGQSIFRQVPTLRGSASAIPRCPFLCAHNAVEVVKSFAPNLLDLLRRNSRTVRFLAFSRITLTSARVTNGSSGYWWSSLICFTVEQTTWCLDIQLGMRLPWWVLVVGFCMTTRTAAWDYWHSEEDQGCWSCWLPPCVSLDAGQARHCHCDNPEEPPVGRGCGEGGGRLVDGDHRDESSAGVRQRRRRGVATEMESATRESVDLVSDSIVSAWSVLFGRGESCDSCQDTAHVVMSCVVSHDLSPDHQKGWPWRWGGRHGMNWKLTVSSYGSLSHAQKSVSQVFFHCSMKRFASRRSPSSVDLDSSSLDDVLLLTRWRPGPSGRPSSCQLVWVGHQSGCGRPQQQWERARQEHKPPPPWAPAWCPLAAAELVATRRNHLPAAHTRGYRPGQNSSTCWTSGGPSGGGACSGAWLKCNACAPGIRRDQLER